MYTLFQTLCGKVFGHTLRVQWHRTGRPPPRGWGGTSICGLYGDASLNRVWVLPLWVWNRVYKSAFLSGTGYICHSDSGTRSQTILLPESRCKRALLLFPLGSRYMFTQTHRFRFEGQPASHIFQSGTGCLFSRYVPSRFSDCTVCQANTPHNASPQGQRGIGFNSQDTAVWCGFTFSILYQVMCCQSWLQ